MKHQRRLTPVPGGFKALARLVVTQRRLIPALAAKNGPNKTFFLLRNGDRSRQRWWSIGDPPKSSLMVVASRPEVLNAIP